MPPYAFLASNELDPQAIGAHLKTLTVVGVPYSQEQIDNAAADMVAQADPNQDGAGVTARYPKANIGNFDGDAAKLTEMDALVAYLQVLGTLVDFSAYKPEENER